MQSINDRADTSHPSPRRKFAVFRCDPLVSATYGVEQPAIGGDDITVRERGGGGGGEERERDRETERKRERERERERGGGEHLECGRTRVGQCRMVGRLPRARRVHHVIVKRKGNKE